MERKEFGCLGNRALFPVITVSRLKFHAHCVEVFVTAGYTYQKDFLKEYKTGFFEFQETLLWTLLLTFLEWPSLDLVTSDLASLWLLIIRRHGFYLSQTAQRAG